MELKIVKQDVSVNEKVFEAAAEQSIDLEITLPDYYPKINKILKCKAVPRIVSSNINGQMLSNECTVNISLFYCGEHGEIFSYEYVMPFCKNFECNGDISDGIPHCTVVEEYLNCRLSSDNKIELHGAVGFCAEIFKKKKLSVISDVDGGCVMQKRAFAPATTVVGTSEKYINIEEELELSSGQPSVNNIIRYCVKAVNRECSIINGKIAVKGEMRVFVLYCGENSETPQKFQTIVPYSKIMEIDGVTDECICACEARVCSLEIKPRTAITGQTRSLSFNAKLLLSAKASCNNDIPVICDAFSTKYESEVKIKEMVFEKIHKTFNENFLCRKRLELGNDNIGNVIDIWCNPKIENCKTENNELHISGQAQICILAYDSENNPTYIERMADFEYKSNFENAIGQTKCVADVSENKISFTIIGNNCIEVTAELTVNAAVYVLNKTALVESVSVDDKMLKSDDDGTALIIYYGKTGDSLWDIARKYNSSPDEIAEINSIDAPELTCEKTLLIPVK